MTLISFTKKSKISKVVEQYKKLSVNKLGYDNLYSDDMSLGTINFTEREDGCNYFNKSKISELSPDNINNVEFWKALHKNFKYECICGKKSTSINEVNLHNQRIIFSILIDSNHHIYDFIYEKLSNPNSNLLEIGYGFGSFIDLLNKHKLNINYYGIDLFNRINKKSNLFETDGWSIPNEIPELDIIFSSNVFQHLTYKQRLNYLMIGYNKLKSGGYFVFNNILYSKEVENKHPNVYGIKDEFGTAYLHMFGQYTELDELQEFIETIKQIGFKLIVINNPQTHLFSFILQKI